MIQVGGAARGHGQAIEYLGQRHVGHGDRHTSDASVQLGHALVHQQATHGK